MPNLNNKDEELIKQENESNFLFSGGINSYGFSSRNTKQISYWAIPELNIIKNYNNKIKQSSLTQNDLDECIKILNRIKYRIEVDFYQHHLNRLGEQLKGGEELPFDIVDNCIKGDKLLRDLKQNIHNVTPEQNYVGNFSLRKIDLVSYLIELICEEINLNNKLLNNFHKIHNYLQGGDKLIGSKLIIYYRELYQNLENYLKNDESYRRPIKDLLGLASTVTAVEYLLNKLYTSELILLKFVWKNFEYFGYGVIFRAISEVAYYKKLENFCSDAEERFIEDIVNNILTGEDLEERIDKSINRNSFLRSCLNWPNIRINMAQIEPAIKKLAYKDSIYIKNLCIYYADKSEKFNTKKFIPEISKQTYEQIGRSTRLDCCPDTIKFAQWLYSRLSKTWNLINLICCRGPEKLRQWWNNNDKHRNAFNQRDNLLYEYSKDDMEYIIDNLLKTKWDNNCPEYVITTSKRPSLREAVNSKLYNNEKVIGMHKRSDNHWVAFVVFKYGRNFYIIYKDSLGEEIDSTFNKAAHEVDLSNRIRNITGDEQYSKDRSGGIFALKNALEIFADKEVERLKELYDKGNRENIFYSPQDSALENYNMELRYQRIKLAKVYAREVIDQHHFLLLS